MQRLELIQRESASAYSVETGFTLNIRFTEASLVRGGYHLLYVGGLALDPKQLDPNRTTFTNTVSSTIPGVFTNVPSELNREGATIFQGWSLGLEISF